MGATAFVLLLFHPALISLSYLTISLAAAAAVLWPTLENFPVWSGITALLITIVLLVLTLYVNLEYDTWKKTHKFLGVALFFAALHVVLIGSTVRASTPLKIYMYTLTAAALGSYTYHTLLRRWLVKRLPFEVQSVKDLGGKVLEIVMKPGAGFKFESHPGQFIFIEPQVLGIAKQSHPFSLTNKSGEANLAVAVKTVGDFTETLRLLQPGGKVYVEGPYGRFSYDFYPNQKQLWIGGGIGITPLLGMARNLKPGSNVTLYYSVKDAAEAVYAGELEEMAKVNPEFHFVLFNSKEKGRLKAEIISNDMGDVKEREIFICGPVPMMMALKAQFKKMGISSHKIHTEEFALA